MDYRILVRRAPLSVGTFGLVLGVLTGQAAGGVSDLLLQPAAERERELDSQLSSIAEGATLRIRAAAWFTNTDGTIQSGEAAAGSTSEIDLEETLGVDTDTTVVIGEIGFSFGENKEWHLDFGYTGPFTYEGTSGAINVTFDDVNFTGVVDSDADIEFYTINLGYDIWENEHLTLTVGGGVRVFDVDLSITGTGSQDGGPPVAQEEQADALAPIPVLSAALRWDINDRLFLKGSGAGLYVGQYGTFVDLAAEIGFDFNETFGLFAGYRYVHAEADINDLEFDLNIDGPYIGAELRF